MQRREKHESPEVFNPYHRQKQRPTSFAGRSDDPLPLARRRFGTVVRELPSKKRGWSNGFQNLGPDRANKGSLRPYYPYGYLRFCRGYRPGWQKTPYICGRIAGLGGPKAA